MVQIQILAKFLTTIVSLVDVFTTKQLLIPETLDISSSNKNIIVITDLSGYLKTACVVAWLNATKLGQSLNPISDLFV